MPHNKCNLEIIEEALTISNETVNKIPDQEVNLNLVRHLLLLRFFNESFIASLVVHLQSLYPKNIEYNDYKLKINRDVSLSLPLVLLDIDLIPFLLSRTRGFTFVQPSLCV